MLLIIIRFKTKKKWPQKYYLPSWDSEGFESFYSNAVNEKRLKEKSKGEKEMKKLSERKDEDKQSIWERRKAGGSDAKKKKKKCSGKQYR